MRGEGGSCGVTANEYSCAYHVTWSPNKLWRSTSVLTYDRRGIAGQHERERKIQENVGMWVSICVPLVKIITKLDNKAKVIL